LILFDSAGDLWLGSQFSVSDGSVAVIEYTPAQIAEMQMGASPTPALTVKTESEFGGLSAITFDEKGNLWIAVPNTESGANGVNGGLVEMFNVAGKTGTLSQPDVMITPSAISSINQSLDEPYGLAFDDQGSLWVANRQSSDQVSGSRNSTGFLVKFAANQITASGSPVPPTIVSPNRKSTNIDNPTTIVFGPTVK
jgi:secreted PhoX family phosphatase